MLDRSTRGSNYIPRVSVTASGPQSRSKTRSKAGLTGRLDHFFNLPVDDEEMPHRMAARGSLQPRAGLGAVADATGGINPASPVVGDFNRDRKPDIAVVHSYDHAGAQPAALLLGNGDGTFQPPLLFPAATGSALAVGDLNNDRYPDLVGGDFDAGQLAVVLNDGNWTAPVPPSGAGRPAQPPASAGGCAVQGAAAAPSRPAEGTLDGRTDRPARTAAAARPPRRAVRASDEVWGLLALERPLL
jgi:hypothetical protein